MDKSAPDPSQGTVRIPTLVFFVIHEREPAPSRPGMIRGGGGAGS